MKRNEFDRWIEEHYGELVAVARRLVNNDADAHEVVHDAVAQTLANGKLAQVRAPWTWMVNAVRGKAKDRRVSADRQARLAAALYAVGEEDNAAA